MHCNENQPHAQLCIALNRRQQQPEYQHRVYRHAHERDIPDRLEHFVQEPVNREEPQGDRDGVDGGMDGPCEGEQDANDAREERRELEEDVATSVLVGVFEFAVVRFQGCNFLSTPHLTSAPTVPPPHTLTLHLHPTYPYKILLLTLQLPHIRVPKLCRARCLFLLVDLPTLAHQLPCFFGEQFAALRVLGGCHGDRALRPVADEVERERDHADAAKDREEEVPKDHGDGDHKDHDVDLDLVALGLA